MRNENIVIPYEEEKLMALRIYTEHKGLNLDKELVGAVDALYSKCVPSQVRDYLAAKCGEDKASQKVPKIAHKVESGDKKVSPDN